MTSSEFDVTGHCRSCAGLDAEVQRLREELQREIADLQFSRAAGASIGDEFQQLEAQAAAMRAALSALKTDHDLNSTNCPEGCTICLYAEAALSGDAGRELLEFVSDARAAGTLARGQKCRRLTPGT